MAGRRSGRPQNIGGSRHRGKPWARRASRGEEFVIQTAGNLVLPGREQRRPCGRWWLYRGLADDLAADGLAQRYIFLLKAKGTVPPERVRSRHEKLARL